MKFTALLVLGFFALIAFAGSASVVNVVNTSVSTGGNSSSGGAVIEGDSNATVRVYTEINGEVVTDFEEKYEASGGESIEVVKEFIEEVGSSSVKTRIRTGNYVLPSGPTSRERDRFEIDREAVQKGDLSVEITNLSATGTASSTVIGKVHPVRKMFMSFRKWFIDVFGIFK